MCAAAITSQAPRLQTLEMRQTEFRLRALMATRHQHPTQLGMGHSVDHWSGLRRNHLLPADPVPAPLANPPPAPHPSTPPNLLAAHALQVQCAVSVPDAPQARAAQAGGRMAEPARALHARARVGRGCAGDCWGLHIGVAPCHRREQRAPQAAAPHPAPHGAPHRQPANLYPGKRQRGARTRGCECPLGGTSGGVTGGSPCVLVAHGGGCH